MTTPRDSAALAGQPDPAAIRCTKCHATGLHNFWRRQVDLLDHPALDVIACRICGNWLKSRPIAVSQTRQFIRREKPEPTQITAPCRVVGCAGVIFPSHNGSGLCRACCNALANWSYKDRTKGMNGLPPVIRQDDGSYLTREALLAKQADVIEQPQLKAKTRRELAEDAELISKLQQLAARGSRSAQLVLREIAP